MPETKTFTKKTELVFTTIEIEKKTFLTISKRYVAEFKYGNSKDNLKEKVITGKYFTDIIEKLERFLDCEIDERHYIIK